VRSVTQRGSSASVVKEARTELQDAGLDVHAEIALSPFSKEHVAIVVGES
jgi:fibrillarin-like rRNA methylase